MRRAYGTRLTFVGYVFSYTRFLFKYLEEFRKLEEETREAGRGLWK